MALIADDSRDRVAQLLLATERLTALIAEETRLIEARMPPLAGAAAEEKNRLANAYRLELARIKQEPALVASAPPPQLAELRRSTQALQDALAGHEIALNAVKVITEGLVQAMAEEVARQRGAAGSYGARGAMDALASPGPTILDRSA
jgi:hypothetical protein